MNTASGYSSTVSGGLSNTASEYSSTVGGGWGNTATGTNSTVVGGFQNAALGAASTVGGGRNTANGDYSVALGNMAQVNGNGSFLFADNSSTLEYVISNSPNEFAVAATGGIAMGTTRTFSNVCRLAPGGGSWACTSDRNVKVAFAEVDPESVLRKVLALPVQTWRFKTQPANVRHMGPMAQDFRAAFGLGTDDKTITQVDVNGVTLAAIQGLHARLEAQLAQKDAAIAELTARVADMESLRGELAAMRSMFAARPDGRQVARAQ